MDAIDLSFKEIGQVVITVSNGLSKHYTYRFRKASENKPVFISVKKMTLFDGATYDYLGVYSPDTRRVHLTKASVFADGSEQVKGVRWAIDKIAKPTTLPGHYTITKELVCRRCGHLLTTPESIASGYGPECEKKKTISRNSEKGNSSEK